VRGIFARVVGWVFGILIFSFVAFVASSFLNAPRMMRNDRFFRRLLNYERDAALRAYQQEGIAGLRRNIDDLQLQNPNHYYLLDAQGVDVLTGRVRKDLLVQPAPPRFPFPPPREFRILNPSPDRRYTFVSELHAGTDWLADLITYGWICGAVVLLAYWMALTLARPIRKLTQTVLRFGQGDLGARARLRRRDEIGQLGRAFDDMAERIETLLGAERRLLQDVSHELRSPLARLNFALELLRNNPSSATAFDRAKKEVDRISRLIGDLLQVTRVEGDAATRNLESIDAGEFLREIIEDCGLEAAARGCTIALHDEADLTVHVDRELLRRAVENVLRNAIRYSPEGGSVELTLAAGEREWSLRVRDSGPGVPVDQLEAIFRPFHRVDEDRSRANGGGVGLGLSIAQRAVLLHHGTIAARNAEPGLVIEMRLPR
jgi:two-component system sensor histidine kinase CpxA